ncbi:MAG: Bug family tripartite tricarboxylate transporter substrate binding protein [Pigmentiphaga sp.]
MKFRFLCVLPALALSLASMPAQAEWPEKPVRVVLPGPPGSSPDRITRLFADRLSQQWQQPVVVENRPGGTTRIGAGMVASAPPDGYTLLSTFSSHGMAKLLHPQTPYDPIADFVPVVKMVSPEVILVVRADSPYQTLEDLVADVKQRGRPLEVGNFGVGSGFHFNSLTLGKEAGIDILPVPFKGEALSLADMLGGHVESSFNSVGTALPHIREGRVRALALVSPERSKVLPDVPTFVEEGIPGLREGSWFGILAPAGTPQPVIEKVHTDVQALLAEPEVTKWLRDQGLEPVFETPEEFAQSLAREVDVSGALIKEFNVTVN